MSDGKTGYVLIIVKAGLFILIVTRFLYMTEISHNKKLISTPLLFMARVIRVRNRDYSQKKVSWMSTYLVSGW